MTAEYEIRVSGIIPAEVLVEIEGARAQVEPAHTVLRGPVLDQSALHGIIDRLHGFGLELIEVRRLADPVGVGPDSDHAADPS